MIHISKFRNASNKIIVQFAVKHCFCVFTKKQKLVRRNGALLISADEKVLFRSGTNYKERNCSASSRAEPNERLMPEMVI